MISQKKNAVAQRVSSSRLQKIKELKNEIFDLQQKLEASSLENQVLKQLQCRYSKATCRYENSKSNFPDLLASHYDEVRTLRKLLRMSQEEERNTSRKLKKVEAELLKSKDALQAMHVLSEDKDLAEREELEHRLSVLTEKIEESDKRIQSLEQQLKLNSNIFSRQLANENKKAMEARIITKDLQMEINSLHQKIKEKDRQLNGKNIYANWMPKIPKQKGDSVPHEKSLSINRSVQVDEELFRSLLPSQYHTQEIEKSPVQVTQEKKSSTDENQTAKGNEAFMDAQCRKEKQSTKKIPKPEAFNRTHGEYLREGRLLMEEYTCLEFMKEEETEKDLLKQKLEKMTKTEQTPLSDSVKENNQEEDAVEEHEKEEKVPEQPPLSDSVKENNQEEDAVEEHEKEEKVPEQPPLRDSVKENNQEEDAVEEHEKEEVPEQTPLSDSVKENNQEEDAVEEHEKEEVPEQTPLRDSVKENNQEEDAVEEHEKEEVPEQTPLRDSVKENNQEEDAVEEHEKEEKVPEQTPLSDSVKENNQEEDAVEEHEKEEKVPDEELNNSEKAGSKCVTPGTRNKILVRLEKKYIFSEATEKLHHGLPTSGTKSKKGSLYNHRHAGQDCCERAESKVKNTFGLYEPSLGKVTKTRWKDSSTEAEGCTHMTFADRKNSLMKELSRPDCV